jgi:hypothetical protein
LPADFFRCPHDNGAMDITFLNPAPRDRFFDANDDDIANASGFPLGPA